MLSLTVSEVAVFKLESGNLVLVGPAGTLLREGQGSVPLPSDYSELTHSWNATVRQMVEDPAKVQTMLVTKIKTTAATKKMAAMSPGTSKTEEYRQKGVEIAASAALTASILNTLTAANALAQYPAAYAESQLSGDPLATVLARFKQGATSSNPEINRLSAIEQVYVRRVKAAVTAADKRAAFNSINWDWDWKKVK